MEEGPIAHNPEILDFDTLKLSTTGTEVANEVKRVLIDLLETIDRCEEEIDMIKTEMNCTIKYYQKQHEDMLRGNIDIEYIPMNFHTVVQLTEPYLGEDINEIIFHLASDEIKLEEADEGEIENEVEALEEDEY
ncbi:hypothetical protein CHS0354_019168 [Potamilus streckersoni]|uniref:Uncharacterized protein n=1 Tax=Potamilus streckersoni TaxID=2493646 RepID=A0AAE0W4V2_9BIVA|nr:hypothetical protein CHS0354_019168 [Potamilus streckersoni]